MLLNCPLVPHPVSRDSRGTAPTAGIQAVLGLGDASECPVLGLSPGKVGPGAPSSLGSIWDVHPTEHSADSRAGRGLSWPREASLLLVLHLALCWCLLMETRLPCAKTALNCREMCLLPQERCCNPQQGSAELLVWSRAAQSSPLAVGWVVQADGASGPFL